MLEAAPKYHTKYVSCCQAAPLYGGLSQNVEMLLDDVSEASWRLDKENPCRGLKL